jgi:hypothetical protein
MLLAEEILILAIDPAGGLVGDGRNATSRDTLARALVLDLILYGSVALDGSLLRVVDTLPLAHRLLTSAMHALMGETWTPDAAVARLRRSMWATRGELMEGFERNGITHRLNSGLFGRFGKPRYALQSTQTRGECLERMRRGCEDPSLDDLHAVALALLAESVGLAQHFLPVESLLRTRRWAMSLRTAPNVITGGQGSPRQRLSALLTLL